MRVSEAGWIARELRGRRCSPLINIGSSTADFRERIQPHIDNLIFAPLRAQGIEIVHTDLKAQPGVDVAGDLLDPAVQAQLRARKPRAILCSNLLEHVPSPQAFARVLIDLLEPGGVALVTVPRSYPYHADPIDTGFRPTPAELAALFAGCALLREEVIHDTTYARELRDRGPGYALRNLVGALRPRGEAARAQRDRLRWLFRPFTTTCIVVERTAARS